MQNIGLNELVKAMLENGTDNIEATYKVSNGVEITLDIVMIKVAKNGEIVYEVEEQVDFKQKAKFYYEKCKSYGIENFYDKDLE